MIKDKNFYNKESFIYSKKRYPQKILNYTQFFFKERLRIALMEFEKNFNNGNGLKCLEIGCADGIILREIEKEFGNNFSEMLGLDIAEKMIEKAEALNTSSKISFFIRGNEPQDKKFDVILELGVINYTDFESEMRYAKNHLNRQGLYVLSVSGNSSSHNYFLGKEERYQNFNSYNAYEEIIKKYFLINKIIPCGFYLPILWKIPTIALFLQPILEKIFHFFPNAFHEKIYLLSVK